MASKRPASQTLRQRYGRGYYHGRQSGYPREGYRAGRQDWTPWLEFLHSLQPTGCLVDLGCAYGYLPAQARQMGFRAFGADISDFALMQEPDFRPFLCQSHLESLPFADQSADLVCLFDVLEHLEDPIRALGEAVRILKPSGLLAGATPDPIFFSGHEPTHCFERPPSFWIEALESLGLAAQFRFSVQAYNFQFLASFPGANNLSRVRRLQHDYFSERPDFIKVSGPLRAVPRSGWSPLSDCGRSIQGDPAAIYLLNRQARPLQVRGKLELDAEDYGALRVLWNSQVIAEIFPAAQPLKGTFEMQDFLLPAGGHHLFFEPLSPGLRLNVEGVRLEASQAASSRLALTLPFDLYQRYQMAGEISRRLKASTTLDWGGVLGDERGHLATSQDFLPAPGAKVASADIRHCDHPRHTPLGPQGEWPDDRTFDLVLSLDVLEHVPKPQRRSFLDRLDRLARRWIILGAPFASAEVEAAEDLLRDGLMAGQRFLQEHRKFGLPAKQIIQRFFVERKGYQLLEFANGWLPRWIECQTLTQHYFALDDYSTATLFNRLCNQQFYACDRREPSYRTLFLICKEPLPDGLGAELQGRLRAPSDPPPAGAPFLSSHPDYLRLQERILELHKRRRSACRDACFLLKEREQHIELLQETVRELRKLNQAPLHKIVLRRLRGQQ